MKLDINLFSKDLAAAPAPTTAASTAHQTTLPTIAPVSFHDVSDEAIEEQIEYYRACLLQEAQVRRQRKPHVQQEADSYAEESLQAHEFEGREVRIFAPFISTKSAVKTITFRQSFLLVLIAVGVSVAMYYDLLLTAVVLLALITLFYVGNFLVTLWLSARTLDKSEEIQIPDEVVEGLGQIDWPRYTILCPLYRETEVVAQFASAMQQLDYPEDKLQILFLTEMDDEETREAIRAAELPAHFQIVTVPDGQPRTKPRACNYGLLETTGDYVVIYDAEDLPDRLQLKKAVMTFASHTSELGCVQAKLNFYNATQNVWTRWFTVEYSTWFDATLPGLQWARFSLPLGGTSNHFPIKVLRDIGAWDAFNVTEDCDLGLRLASNRMYTVVLDSTTLEEANPNVRNWIRQRSRWIKGYMQTYLIHMRNPERFRHRSSWRDLLSLQLIIGGRTAVLLINPLMWVMLVLYFVFRPRLDDLYNSLFPGMILYMAVVCLIFGNLTYIYIHFIGCLKREEYGLIKWTLLMPIYWAAASYAAFKALHQLITKPHYWEKTKHGLHLQPPPIPVKQEASSTAAVEESAPLKGVWQIESIEPAVEQVAVVTAEQATVSRAGNGHYSGNGNGHYADNGQPDDAVAVRDYAVNGSTNGSKEWILEADEQAPVPELRAPKRLQRLRLPEDGWLTATVAVACVASVLATWYFFEQKQLLIYNDAFSHLAISRFVFDNSSPGLAQLGGVWLPLPHVLMIPFVAIEPFWRTGLAGAAVSMPMYVLTALYVFLSVRRLTHNSIAGFIGALTFVLNPNVLYLQATPLTEVLAAATITSSTYYFLSWIQDQKPQQLLYLAIATFLATLSRYDGWALAAGFMALIPVITFIKQRKLARIEANVIIFALLGCLGIALWFMWCALILGDPLYFQRSEFSAQAQQQAFIDNGTLYTYHNVVQAIRFFTVLCSVTFGHGLFILGAVGLGMYLWNRRKLSEAIAVLIFLVPFAFYIFSAYSGQIVFFSPELVPDDAQWKYFNNRYGLVAIPPFAVFVGLFVFYFGRWIGRVRPAVDARTLRYRAALIVPAAALIVGQAVVTMANGPVALRDGQVGMSCYPRQEFIAYMAEYYDGGKILVDTFANAAAFALGPEAGVPFRNFVYEGSGDTWRRALRNPSAVADWIIVDPNVPTDKVAKSLDINDSLFLAEYTLVVQERNDGRKLFRRSSLPEPTKRQDGFERLVNNDACPSG
ncbi:MAG: glycosyltransferase [Anaerolineae bacterium]|nr:glycosyltransferase [Anaerolineae bacterium]